MRASSVYGVIVLVFLFSLVLGRVFRDANPLLVVVPVVMMSVIAVTGIIRGMRSG